MNLHDPASASGMKQAEAGQGPVSVWFQTQLAFKPIIRFTKPRTTITPDTLFFAARPLHIKFMQAQRLLRRTTFSSNHKLLVRGFRFSRPLLLSNSKFQNQFKPLYYPLPQAHIRSYTMASATSFYDFKPLDSKQPYLQSLHILPPFHSTPPPQSPRYPSMQSC